MGPERSENLYYPGTKQELAVASEQTEFPTMITAFPLIFGTTFIPLRAARLVTLESIWYLEAPIRPCMVELQPRAVDWTSELDRESSLDAAISGRQQDRCAVSLPHRYGTLA